MTWKNISLWVLSSLVISLVMTLPSIYFFSHATGVAPIANIVAIPLMQFFILPLSMLTVLTAVVDERLAQRALDSVAWIFDKFWGYVLVLQELDWQWETSLLWWTYLAFLIGGTVIFMAPSWKSKLLGSLFFVPIFSSHPPPFFDLSEGEFMVTLLDVGQGSSLLIFTENHVLLYDAGPGYNSGFNTGNAVVLPYLRSQRIEKLDTLIVSHNDTDHMGGIPAVLNSMDVEHLLSGEPYHHRHRMSQACHSGVTWEWDGVRFSIVYPPKEKAFRLQGNNASCVLRVASNHHSILIPGDIERQAEHTLVINALKSPTNPIKSNWLVGPHHGSKTSSGGAFLNAVGMNNVAFLAGNNNRFGFPHNDVVKRFDIRNARIFETSKSGQITLYFPSSETENITQRRCQKKRYWHTPSTCSTP